MSELDYKNFVEGKYPEPKDRMKAKDFPLLDELYTYGVDFDMPESLDDLRCRYNIDERIDAPEMEELRGFKVPPLGMTYVAVHGGGGKQGQAFGPGVFRENKHTIGKELGVSPTEITLIREDKKEQALLDGMVKAMEEHEIELDGRTSADVLGTLAYILTDKLLEEKAPVKELRLWYGDVLKILTSKEETIKKNRESLAIEVVGKSMDAMLESLKLVERGIEREKGEVVDVKFVDVSGESDSAEDI